jgi:pimeloyl-ACP methyl ester carboxylesterase
MRLTETLPTGAEMRTAGAGPLAVVGVDGGGRSPVQGTWSASLEWLVTRLAPGFPEVRFAEVRYRIRSWTRLDLCIEDGLAAVEALAPERTLMLGFSMGGAVSVAVARHPSVWGVVGLAPWIPEPIDLSPLDGKRLAIVHGALDSPLPGPPGVTARSSRGAWARARARDIETSYAIVAGGLHGVAFRSPWGRPLPLPRSGVWLRLVAAEIARFRDEAMQ